MHTLEYVYNIMHTVLHHYLINIYLLARMLKNNNIIYIRVHVV